VYQCNNKKKLITICSHSAIGGMALPPPKHVLAKERPTVHDMSSVQCSWAV